MWLTSSSIGRKFIMALTGVCLVLFVTFHSVMNAVAIVWPDSYNVVCKFLGANWYALIASAGLAILFIIHIIYAVWLTVQNRRARGVDRYAINGRPKQVEWSSKNMLVLGIVILAFLVVHLIQFWAKMQWAELAHKAPADWATVNGVGASPFMGTLFLQDAFSMWWTLLIYMIGFVALWFHMTHGFWSMFQSVGWNGRIWLPRLRRIGYWWTTIFVGLFAAEAIIFTVQAHNNHYLTDLKLQAQYAEIWDHQAEEYLDAFQEEMAAAVKSGDQLAVNNALMAKIPDFIKTSDMIYDNFEKQCPDVAPGQYLMAMMHQAEQWQQMMQFYGTPESAVADPEEDAIAVQGNAEVVEANMDPNNDPIKNN